jgi:FkbM family methyltransferase
MFNVMHKSLAEHLRVFAQDIYPTLKQKYHLINPRSTEVFYFHHSLRLIDGRIKQKLKNKDILDIGAYNGDSALVLSEYGRSVYCFELSPKNFAVLKRILGANPNYSATVHPLLLGVSDRTAEVHVSRGSADARIGAGKQRVNVTTIDDFVEGNNLTVGFMKADVEGHALSVVKGAAKTMLRDRPVFSFSCYHAFHEMYDVSRFLMNLLPNYHFEWHSENRVDWAFFELSFAGYPVEALK